MTAMQQAQHEKYQMPRDEIDQLIGREPAAPEQAARDSAAEIIRSVQVDVAQLLRNLTLSGSSFR